MPFTNTLAIPTCARLGIMVSLACLVPPNLAGARQDPNWCEAQFAQMQKPFSESVAPDYSKLLEQWKKLAMTCGGTGVYEGRLAGLYMRLHQPEEARATLQAIKDPVVRDFPTVKAAWLHLKFTELLLRGGSSINDIKTLEPQYLAFAKANTEWEGSYEAVSLYELAIGNPATAIPFAERATQMLPNAWINYRTLTIAYSMVNRYADAAKAGDTAQSLNRAVSADQDFMLALARSYAVLHDKETVEAVLGLIVHYHPDIRGSRKFSETMVFVRKQLGVGVAGK